MKEECPHNLTANTELCPLSIATYLPPEAELEHLKTFFSVSVERDMECIYNISPGQIVMLVEDPKFQNGTFTEKWNAVVDLFVQGLLEKRKNIPQQDNDVKQDNGAVKRLATAWERAEHLDLLARRAMLAMLSSKSTRKAYPHLTWCGIPTPKEEVRQRDAQRREKEVMQEFLHK